MKVNKTLLSFLLSLFISTSFMAIFPGNALAAGYAISTQYYGYNSNQTITVNYSGTSGKDWIGIYKVNTTPSSSPYNAALAWKYNSGYSGSMTFSPSDFINSQYSPEKGRPLQPGVYKAVICLNDGYTVAASYQFEIQGEKPKYSFDVVSDIHTNSNTAVNLDRALNDIRNMSPNDKCIVANGDTADLSGTDYYNVVQSTFYNNRSGLPFTFFNLGNHELFDTYDSNTLSSFSTKFNRFLNYTKAIHSTQYDPNNYKSSDNRTTPYYEQIVNGNHFIFLSSETLKDKDKADLSSTQLEWLDNKLWNIAKYGGDQPVFVFLHQSLANTVAGSYSYQGWNGVLQDSQLRFILNKYPNVFFFTGHSHWNLSSAHTMFQDTSTYGSTLGATMFNDASVTGLWSDSGYMDGSQGYHIDVYGSKVVVNGRDFLGRGWIPAGTFTIDLNAKYAALHSQTY
ncbi:MAG: metallophosphoesterase [Clostridiaceae bacterium]